MFRLNKRTISGWFLGLVFLLIPATAFAGDGTDVTETSTLLTWITFLPLLGALIIVALPKKYETSYKKIALIATFLPLVLSIYVFMGFDSSVIANPTELKGAAPSLQDYTQYGLQYVHHATWISSFNIEYFVGVDGISIIMLLLSTLIMFIATLSSYLVDKPVNPEKGYLSGIQKQQKGYYALLLLLATGMTGVFVAMDIFLFYVFWEVMLLPMYFLIGIWGGPRKEYAAIKFFLYTLVGSLAMLVAFIFMYYNASPSVGSYVLANGDQADHTFNIMFMSYQSSIGWTTVFTQNLAWILLFVAFAVKVPMFPFHTWLPDAHVEAPTPVSVILAGVLLKMGTYGMLRFNWQMLPESTLGFADMVSLLGVIGILWGAYCAMAQTDLKRLIAYSSVSHMGFVLLGMGSLTAEGINGGVFQMFSHGLVTGMLFLLVGVVYDRAHHRNIDGFGGIAKVTPVFTFFIGLSFMASLGLPGLSGFIGEVMIFIGAFQRTPILTIFAVTSVVITAGYMLWSLQRVFLGPLNEKYADMTDLNWREKACLIPLAIPVVIFGLYPAPILDSFSGALTSLNSYVVSFGG
jgi:NADH-quinone oxidoreductase subunit M